MHETFNEAYVYIYIYKMSFFGLATLVFGVVCGVVLSFLQVVQWVQGSCGRSLGCSPMDPEGPEPSSFVQG